MRLQTCIKGVASERGTTAAELARQLHLYPSNLSGMDAGKRAVSLKLLTRIAEFLGCSPADLLEVSPFPSRPIFKSSQLLLWLEEKERNASNGLDRKWVHRTLLAWQRHYRAPRANP